MIYLDHLLEATGGTLLWRGSQPSFSAFSHDTRQLIPGELFVAVRGEHGDGHDYLLEAAQRGAGGILLEAAFWHALAQETQQLLQKVAIALIAVPDTRIALQQYAGYILRRWRPIVIAVTGSTGKTSTKEAIATMLSGSFATFRSWQNYNDLLGLPLSLGRLEERHEYAVLELSCDHPGEIRDLCAIVQPRIGVLTNISPTQLQYFGTLERLAEELGCLLASLPIDGVAIVNGDDALIRAHMAQCQAAIVAFSLSAVQRLEVRWDLHFDVPASVHLSARLLGKHHVTTMLAAYYVGRHCGLTADEICGALAEVQAMPGRLNALEGLYGATLLDDTHNATPASMVAGLEALQALPAEQRIAVLGDMLRLGSYEEEGHRLIGEKAAVCVDYLITRGERAALIAEAARAAGLAAERIIATSTHADAAQVARDLMQLAGRKSVGAEGNARALVLIKGSEEARMEKVTEQLMAEPQRAPEQLVRQTPGWKQIVITQAERPTWVEIDLSAIAGNTRLVQTIVGPRVRILTSLKADAYGHGALKVARTVLLNGASMLGVATVSEAAPLRAAGVSAPMLVFGYVPAWQMREAIRLELTITLYSVEAAQALSRAARALGKTVNVHVKVDSGMGRLGVRSEEAEEVLTLVREIHRLPGLKLEGLFTHFASADASDQSHAKLQLGRFLGVLRMLEERELRPPLVHAANSAALLSLPEARFDMVRPGVALYGLEPSGEIHLPPGFRPALSFKTQVAQVKTVPEGECISYGCAYVTKRRTRVAVLPVGYADGFRRAPSNWGSVLVHGQEAPILGRVCMDQCMIDVTHIPSARVGDEVVLIGRQGTISLTAEMVAERLGTSNYEVVSAILARVPRVD